MFAEKRIVFFFFVQFPLWRHPKRKVISMLFCWDQISEACFWSFRSRKVWNWDPWGMSWWWSSWWFFFIPYVRPDFSRGDFWWQMGGGKRLTSLDSRDRFSLSRVRDKPYDGAHKDVFLVSLSLWKVSDWTCRMHRITSNHLIAKGCKGRLVSVTSKKGNYLTMLTSFKVLSLLLYSLTENE